MNTCNYTTRRSAASRINAIVVVLSCLLLFLAGSGGRAATMATDQNDYVPGQIVIITGSGWLPGETVLLHVDEDPWVDPQANGWTATADANGNITDASFAIAQRHLGVKFVLTATGQTLGLTAQTLFSDGTLSFFAGDCATSKIAFCLNDTVCAKAAGLTGGLFAFEWFDSSGVSRRRNPASGFSAGLTSDTFVPSSSGTWIVKVYKQSGVTEATGMFTVIALPESVAVTGSSSVSPQQANVTYSVTPRIGSTYAWTVPTGAIITAGATGPNNNSITVTFGNNGGDVTVTETSILGCPGATQTKAVTVNAMKATSAISGNSSVCANQAGVTYSVLPTSGSSYGWTVPSGATITAGATGPNNNVITVTFGSAGGGVTVIETNALGLVGAMQTKEVSVNSPPTANAGPARTICAGSSVTIGNSPTASGGAGPYTYSWSPTSGLSSATDANPIATPSSTTTYAVTVIDANGCSASASVVVTVSAASVGGTATAAGSPICSAASTTISLSGQTGSIMTWQASVDGTTWMDLASTANPLDTGALTQTTKFRAIVQNGVCPKAYSSEAIVAVNPASVGGTASAPPATICSNSSATITLAGNTGSIQWQSSLDNTTFTDINGATSSTLNTGPLPATTYFRAKVTSGVCAPAYSSLAKVTVAESLPPVIVCAGDKTVECGSAWEFDRPSAVGVRDGTNVMITVLSTTTNALAGNSFSATRTWQVQDTCGNTAQCHQTVTVKDTMLPQINCPGNMVSCQPKITFEVSASDRCDAKPRVDCTRSDAQPLEASYPSGTTTINCTATDADGNQAQCSFTVTVKNDIALTPLVSQSVCAGQTVTFSTSASGTGPFSFAWYKDGNQLSGENNSSLAVAAVSPQNAGAYCVVVTGACGSVTNCATLTLGQATTAALVGASGTTCAMPDPTAQLFNTFDMTPVSGFPDSFLKATLQHVPAGYAISDGTYLGWCVDYQDVLYPQNTYKARAYYTYGWLPTFLQNTNWPFVNYLLNHKQGTAVDVQDAIWYFIGGPVDSRDSEFYPPSLVALAMVADAQANGANFVPAPGDASAVVLELGQGIQRNIIEVRCPTVIKSCLGASAAICVAAAGGTPVAYQWFKNGQWIAKAVGACLNFPQVGLQDAGVYRVVVTGPCNSVTIEVTLQVEAPTTSKLVVAGGCRLPPVPALGNSSIILTADSGLPNSFLQVTLRGVPAGYALSDGVYRSWCVDYAGLISPSVPYQVILHDSVGPLPPELQDSNWDKVNYILNHKRGTAVDVQNAIWHFIGGPVDSSDTLFNPPSATVADIVADTEAHGTGFLPGPGQLHAVIVDLGAGLQRNIIESDCNPLARCLGESVTLCAATAGGGPLSYLWLKDGNVISNVAGACLTINNLSPNDAGQYSLVVSGDCSSATNSAIVAVDGGCGSGTNTTRRIQSSAPAIAQATVLYNGNVLFKINGAQGQVCIIECSTDLHHWTPVVSFFNTDGTVEGVDPDAATSDRHFYRVLVMP